MEDSLLSSPRKLLGQQSSHERGNSGTARQSSHKKGDSGTAIENSTDTSSSAIRDSSSVFGRLLRRIFQSTPNSEDDNDGEEDGSSSSVLWHLQHSTKPPLPLLMLNDVVEQNIKFCFLSDGSIHAVKIPPELLGCRVVGSSHGWLLMSSAVPIKRTSFFQHILMSPIKFKIKNFLFNPFSKAIIHLPSQTALPFYRSDELRFIGKASLSCAPTPVNIAAGRCVIAIVCVAGKLAFCKPGDASWSILESAGCYYNDIAFYEGKLHAISSDQNLSIFNGVGSGEVTRQERRFSFKCAGEGLTMYLVQSNRDLILVLRLWKDEPEYDKQLFCPIRTFQFKVFRLDCNSEQWIEINSLGDQMLFLGTNCSVSYTAPKPGFAENTIYFTDDNFDYFFDEDQPSELRDLGLFRLDKGSLEPCFQSSLSSFSSRYIWVEPSSSLAE